MTEKDGRLYLRIREDIKNDLKITAELHGLTMSSLINSLIVKAIREAKIESPQSFEKGLRLVNVEPAKVEYIEDLGKANGLQREFGEDPGVVGQKPQAQKNLKKHR
jgi:antitoxin component of RelBE/YafQ-DinJ toxin-antitoxin module